MSYSPGLTISTTEPVQALDVTPALARRVREMSTDGLLALTLPHTTAALVLTENDPDFFRDIARTARELLAPLEPFEHHRNNNPNAAAHLFSIFCGVQVLVPCHDGELGLGQHQRVILIELDGPKDREIALAPCRR